MIIKDIQTLVVNAEMRNWVFVKIITDQDLYGWGEATVEWKTRAVVGAIDDLKPLLIGKDPRQIKQNFQIDTQGDFNKIWQWSVDNPIIFWKSIWDFTKVKGNLGNTILQKSNTKICVRPINTL